MKQNSESVNASINELIPIFKEYLALGRSVRFSPKGESMLPLLKEGRDTVTLSPIMSDLKKYDVVLYQRDNGQYVLHRILKASEAYTCIGDNQINKETGLRRDQMIAIMTSFTRGNKSYTVNNLLYKIYCRVWTGTIFPRRVIRSLKYRLSKVIKNRSK